jgi:hypothetical protein
MGVSKNPNTIQSVLSMSALRCGGPVTINYEDELVQQLKLSGTRIKHAIRGTLCSSFPESPLFSFSNRTAATPCVEPNPRNTDPPPSPPPPQTNKQTKQNKKAYAAAGMVLAGTLLSVIVTSAGKSPAASADGLMEPALMLLSDTIKPPVVPLGRKPSPNRSWVIVSAGTLLLFMLMPLTSGPPAICKPMARWLHYCTSCGKFGHFRLLFSCSYFMALREKVCTTVHHVESRPHSHAFFSCSHFMVLRDNPVKFGI